MSQGPLGERSPDGEAGGRATASYWGSVQRALGALGERLPEMRDDLSCYTRVQADRAISDQREETSRMARRRLRRDREYVAALLEGCDFLRQMLPQALERLRERL